MFIHIYIPLGSLLLFTPIANPDIHSITFIALASTINYSIQTHATDLYECRQMNCERLWNGNYANKSDLETGVNREAGRQMAGQARNVQFRHVNRIYLHLHVCLCACMHVCI